MAVIFRDTFSGSGTLDGHSPDLAPLGADATWTPDDAYPLSGGVCTFEADGGAAASFGWPPQPNGDLALTWTFSKTESADAAFRFNLYDAVNEYELRLNWDTGAVDLFRIFPTGSTLYSGVWTPPVGDDFVIEWLVSAAGGHEAIVNGVTAFDGAFAATISGLEGQIIRGGGLLLDEVELDLGAAVPASTEFWTSHVGTTEGENADASCSVLTKTTSISYSAGTPGSPGFPGIPARAAYTSTAYVTVCRYRQVSVPPYSPPSGGNGSEDYSTVGGEAIPGSWVYQCLEEAVTTFHPAQPAVPGSPAVAPVPSQRIVNYRLGWNSGARSIAFFARDGYVEFYAPNAVGGLVAGLNDFDGSASYSEIDHAFYVAGGAVRVYEQGAQKLIVGLHDETKPLRIDRQNGTVRYYLDDALVYTSLLPSSGPVFLDTSIFTGGDAVLCPSVHGYSASDAQMQPLGGAAFDDSFADFAFSVASMQPLAAVALPSHSTALSALMPLAGFAADRPIGSVVSELLPLSGNSESGFLVVETVAIDVAMPYLITAASGLTGEIGGAAVFLAPMDGLSSGGAYGESVTSMAPLFGFAHALEGSGNASLGSGAAAASAMTGEIMVLLTMSSSGEITSVFAAEILLDATLVSAATASSLLSSDFFLDALLYSYASASSIDSEAQAPGEVWVVNLDTAASSRYDNFNFNSFAKIGDAYFGMRPDGLYELGGDDDAGTPIQTRINFGRQNFGSSMLKRIESAYMAVSSYGTMYLKVTDHDGQTYTYAARRNTSKLEQQRVDVGRGIEANYLTFEIVNSALGEDFELAGAEFMAVDLSRRIR